MTPTRVPTRALSGVAALALSFGGAVGAFVVAAGPASADTITVTNTADDGSATSLRGVLETVDAGDVVVLTAGETYQLTICEEPAPAVPHAAEGSAGWGDIEVNAAVTIVGNGATIEQTCDDRVLYTEDAITLEHVTVTGGETKDPGGGLFEDSDNLVTLTGATFTGNSAGSGGGGVATFGDLNVTGSTFTDNHSTDEHGGAIRVFSDEARATIDSSTLSGNTADGWGGAFEQEGTEIIDGTTVSGLFELSVTNSTIANNTAEGDGAGGLDTEDPAMVNVDHSTVSGNHGGIGGGVGTFGTGTTFSANASTFSANTSDDAGGAVLISEIAEPTADLVVPPNSATFLNSTITGNTEAASGAVTVLGSLTLEHVTMTDNTSLGIEPDTSATLGGRGDVSAMALEGDAANLVAFELTSADSVVAQAHGAMNCAGPEGAVSNDEGYNFSDDESCAFASPTSNVKTPNDPVLGALANNGGATKTLLPEAGSPLLDVIPPAVCGATVDQRGVSRPQGTGCDIGAVEVEVVPTPTPAPAAVVTPKFTG